VLSQTAEYALRAVFYLAERPEQGPVRVNDIAEALDVPQNYLSKILHVLARSGVLSSLRGPHGGFNLAAAPGELRLIDVVSHFDELTLGRRCVLGRPRCSDANPCGAHERWKPVAARIAAFFRDTTVADALASARAGGHSAAGAEVPLPSPIERVRAAHARAMSDGAGPSGSGMPSRK
jgi:Rrf2 family protein